MLTSSDIAEAWATNRDQRQDDTRKRGDDIEDTDDEDVDGPWRERRARWR